MFQLTVEEIENLRCKNFASSWGGTRYLSYAFTEQGITYCVILDEPTANLDKEINESSIFVNNEYGFFLY